MEDLGGWHRRLTEVGPRTWPERLLLFGMRPCGLLLGGLTRLRAAAYQLGLFKAYRAPVPVISVGNLAVGGTGKTPVTDFLVKELLGRGLRVAVVSRGYGGTGVAWDGLVGNGQGPLVGPQAAGDEPFLLARRNPQALVLVNPRRRLAVAAAVEKYGAQVIVLDDGFQHLGVARDLDIVLLDSRRPLGNGRVLPAGRLREPVAALKRADLLLFTRHDGGDTPPLPVARPMLTCRHRLASQVVSLEGGTIKLASLVGSRGVAFAGIADPEGFFTALTAAGLDLAERIPLADHVAYDPPLVDRLARAAAGADYLITTEKDAVKLAGARFPVPCYLAPLDLVFADPERLGVALDDCLLAKEPVMTLDPKLLEILACPKCKGPVTLNDDESGLDCAACRVVYPVRDNIPVMLIDEAEPF